MTSPARRGDAISAYITRFRTAPPTSPAERRGAAAPRRMWWQLDESAAGDGGGDVSTSSFEAAEAAAAAAVGEGVGPWQADDDGADAAAGDPLHALRARLGAAAPASASVFDTALADASDAATCSGGGAGGAESGVGWRRAARVLPNAAGEADAGVRAETIAERVLRHVRSTAPVPAHVSGVPSPPSSPPPPPPPPPPRAPARAPLSPTAAAAAPATLPLSPPGLPSVRAAPAPHSPTVVRSQSPEFDAAGRGGGRGGGGGAVYAAAPRRPAEASPASRATNVSRAEFEAYVEMLMSAPLDSWVGSPDAPASPGALLAGARASAQDWMGAAGGGAAWAADYAVPAALPPMAPVCGGFPPDATAVRRALGGGRGAGVVEDVAATIARCRARVSGAGSPGDCSPSSRSQSDDGDSGGASDAASGDSLSDGPHSDDGGSSGDGTDGEPGGGGCEEGRMGTVGWSAPPPPSGVAVTSADADTSLESSEAAGRPSVVIPVIDVSAVSDGNGSGGSATDAPLSSGDDTSGMAPEQAVAILHVINALASSPPSRGAAAAAAVAAQRDGHDWAEDDGVPPLREGPLSPPRRPSPRIGIAAQGIRLTPRTRLSSLSSLGGARRGGHQVIDTLVKTTVSSVLFEDSFEEMGTDDAAAGVLRPVDAMPGTAPLQPSPSQPASAMHFDDVRSPQAAAPVSFLQPSPEVRIAAGDSLKSAAAAVGSPAASERAAAAAAATPPFALRGAVSSPVAAPLPRGAAALSPLDSWAAHARGSPAAARETGRDGWQPAPPGAAGVGAGPPAAVDVEFPTVVAPGDIGDAVLEADALYSLLWLRARQLEGAIAHLDGQSHVGGHVTRDGTV